MAEKSTSSGRGFRGMDPKKQREIAAKGGRASRGGRSKSNKSGTSQAGI